MRDPKQLLESCQIASQTTVPHLQRGLNIAEMPNKAKGPTTQPDQLFAVVCTERVCYTTSYTNGIFKLVNIACGDELVSETFDGAVTITFYHPVCGAAVYYMKQHIIDKLSKFPFFDFRKNNIPVSAIPKHLAAEVTNWIYTLDDDQIFGIILMPKYKVEKMALDSYSTDLQY